MKNDSVVRRKNVKKRRITEHPFSSTCPACPLLFSMIGKLFISAKAFQPVVDLAIPVH